MMQHRRHRRDCNVAFRNRRIGCALGILSMLLPMAMLSGGCRTLGRKGPVPEDVAHARQLSQQGLSAMQRGDWASAESSLGQAVKACPVDVESRRHYAETLWRRGQRELALTHLQQAMVCAPDDMSLPLSAGQIQLELACLDEARQLADQVLDVNPQSSGGWALRGRVESASGQYDRALADFQRALEFSPNDRDLLYQTAEIYRRLNRPQRALATLTSLRDTYGPGETPQEVLYLEGLALQALARPADAAEAFALALTRGEPNAELAYRLGESQLAAGRQAEAENALEQALAIDPHHGPSLALRQRAEIALRPLGTLSP